jgi:hypothetical protein
VVRQDVLGYNAGGCDGELDIGCYWIRCLFGVGWLFSTCASDAEEEEEYAGKKRLGQISEMWE